MKQLTCKCGLPIFVDDEKYERLFLHQKYNTWSCNGKTVHWNFTQNGVRVTRNVAHLVIDVPIGFEPDHKDRNIHNMQASNLRLATRSQQLANTRTRSDNFSGYRGVCYRGGTRTRPWSWEISKEGQCYRGTALSAEEAAKTRDKKAIELFGEFAFTNFPREELI